MTVAEQIAALRRTLNRWMTRRLATRSGRPFDELRALHAVAKDGVQTQAELGDRLLMDAPQVSRLVDRLERDGLMRRGEGSDRRCVRLEVTRAAGASIEILEDELGKLDKVVRAHLTKSEADTLVRLTRKLHQGLLQEVDSRRLAHRA